MTDYYVGKGGDNGANGTTWALRRLTVESGETLLSAADTLVIGPGVYREEVTTDIAGSSGNEIIYEGDVTGYRTNGVGGEVVITGSDDDIVRARDTCITVTHDYRTFRSLQFEMPDLRHIQLTAADNIVIEDCVFAYGPSDTSSNTAAIYIDGDIDDHVFTVRRCFFWLCNGIIIKNVTTTGLPSTSCVFEYCYFFGFGGYGFYLARDSHSAFKIKNCTFLNQYHGIDSSGLRDVGNILLNSCIFINVQESDFGGNGFTYNSCYAEASGGGVTAMVHWGFDTFFRVSEQSPFIMKHTWYPGQQGLKSSALTPYASDLPDSNLWGITVEQFDGHAGCFSNTWGTNYQRRSTDNSGWPSNFSINQKEVQFQQFIIPHPDVQITVSVQCKKDSGYTGNEPRMIIKQPGQSDRNTSHPGGTGSYSELSDTFTPSSTTPYIVVQLENRTSNTTQIYWDSLRVTT